MDLLGALGDRLRVGRSRLSRPSAGAPQRHLRVAAVLDRFSAESLGPDVTLLNLDARTWLLELAWFRPDFLFVESAWRGHGDTWRRRIASYPGRRRDPTLAALLYVCRRLRIPTVFWNKEDPVHYDRFIDAARPFDYVLTTAAEKIPSYRRDCSLAAHRVAVLPFAVQPALYATTTEVRTREVVFAGSYGESHFPERRRHLELLLDGAIAATAEGGQVRVFDRNADGGDPDKQFPTRFKAVLAGALDYQELAGEYQRARVGLNINSVTDSATMFSRRVVEMLACGLPVVSTAGRGMSALLGDAVTVVETADEAEAAIRRLLEDDEHWRRQSERGLEIVGAGHTIADRIGTIARLLRLGD